jgi:uncharacterized damage-inducible protein DinB
MKRGVVCALILGVGVAVGAARLRAADNAIVGPLKTQWESTRNLVVKVAEAVPEDKYDWKPTPEVRSFREQLVHIASENHLFMGFVAGEKSSAPQNLKTKNDIVKALNESYDYGTKVLDGLTDEKAMESVPAFRGAQQPRWSIAMMNMMDNMDHYGNLVVYMRTNGITPPRSAPK